MIDPLGSATIHGIDFTSAPRPRKPIVVASGRMRRGRLRIDSLERLATFDAFDAFLRREGPWVGAFDFPFGLSRELVRELDWPSSGPRPWEALVRHLQAMPRAAMVDRFRSFCDARPAGRKFAHRATDGPAGSSPSMKWVNPPVALMLHAGAPRLLDAGVSLPGLHVGDPSRIALEGYPGYLARSFVARRSYKSDAPIDDQARRQQRERILAGVVDGPNRLDVLVTIDADLAGICRDDASGDSLDAVLCAVMAAWAWQRRDAGFGLPRVVDPIEGWIVAVPDERLAEEAGSVDNAA